MKTNGKKPLIIAVLVVPALLAAGWFWHSTPAYEVSVGSHIVEKAFYNQQSDLMVEVDGQVVRVVTADRGDSSLQWFQMRTPTGQHLMVAHDFGIEGPIPLSPLDAVTVRGRYEWTESGGTIRKTERDSSLERMHGWIEFNGRRYD